MHYTMIVNQVDISRCLQRILNINHLRTVRSLREVVSCHISFSRNTGAPAFALDHFALPLFLDYTVLEGSHPKRYKKAAPSFTPSHPLPVAVSHTSAAKALSHQTLQSASTLTTSTPRMAEDVRARMAQRTRPKCVPRFLSKLQSSEPKNSNNYMSF